uniref:EGF-like domain-containing protein n=1 Tax=Hucho hucho TaxID=62062 RepID=A0A4W5KVR1_9TELE
MCYNTRGRFYCHCRPGFRSTNALMFTSLTGECKDLNECLENPQVCGNNTICLNTIGSYNCQCLSGFRSTTTVNFTALTGECKDLNECLENPQVCGNNTICLNTIGSYNCQCLPGFRVSTNTGRCEDEDECVRVPPVCGALGMCTNTPGRYTCNCPSGLSNHGNNTAPCTGEVAEATVALTSYPRTLTSDLRPHDPHSLKTPVRSHNAWRTCLTHQLTPSQDRAAI